MVILFFAQIVLNVAGPWYKLKLKVLKAVGPGTKEIEDFKGSWSLRQGRFKIFKIVGGSLEQRK